MGSMMSSIRREQSRWSVPPKVSSTVRTSGRRGLRRASTNSSRRHEIVRPATQALRSPAAFIQGVDHQVGQSRARPLVLEVDAARAARAQALHIGRARVQKVVDHQVGPLGQHRVGQILMPLAHDAIVLAGDAFHGQLALARADKGDLVAGNLMGQHERAEDMAHADGRIARHHKNHMPSPQQASQIHQS